MNRNRMLLGFGSALVVASLASSYVYRQLQQVHPGNGGQMAKLVQVVVAAGPLKMGRRLAPNDVALVDWPEGKQPQGSLARVEEAVGRALTVPLVQGEVIVDQELAGREAGAGMIVAIPNGMRAVSVGVDEVRAVAGYVTPGTIVDVLVTGMGQGGPVTRTILEHVRVLAVGQDMQAESGKPQIATVVTLLVSPEEGEKLTLAAADGKIHLALRNTADTADANPLPVYGSAIFSGNPRMVTAVGGSMARPLTSVPPFTVQVVRGDKVETQSFPQGSGESDGR